LLVGRKFDGRCVKPTSKNNANKRCRRPIKLRISYALNLAASVTFTFKLQASGRMVNGRCVKPSTKNRKYSRCSRLVRRGGNLIRRGKAGANSFVFGAKIGGRPLGPDSYQLTATPSGGAPKRVWFELRP
jgi:hypothetical protein